MVPVEGTEAQGLQNRRDSESWKDRMYDRRAGSRGECHVMSHQSGNAQESVNSLSQELRRDFLDEYYNC